MHTHLLFFKLTLLVTQMRLLFVEIKFTYSLTYLQQLTTANYILE